MIKIKSKFPREVLNEIKWRKDLDINKINIYYIHRGALNDTKIISGEDIIDIGKFLEIKTEGFNAFGVQNICIPYHRIIKIKYDDEIVFERDPRSVNKR